MPIIRGKAILQKLYQTLSKRPVYHTIMWLGYIMLFMLLMGGNRSHWFTFTNSLIHVFFFSMGVYFNLYYLIPKYLSQKKYLRYFFFLILTALAITPLEMVALYIKITDDASRNLLINNQAFHFVHSFVVIGTSTIMKIISDWIRHQRVQKDLETRTLQTELRFLRSQINPHFLFNTLNSLYALTLKKSDKAPEIVLRLSEMMRYMLYECNEKVVPLGKEINYMKNYLELEKIRHGNKVEISLDVVGNNDNKSIAPMMFIPFLENSFKHGLSNQLSNGFVHIRLNVEENNIDFEITNSKPSFRDNNYHRGGIGLTNIKRRLEILYPKHYLIDIKDSLNTYSVNLKIALEND